MSRSGTSARSSRNGRKSYAASFREYVAGKGPQKIAADLNRDEILSLNGTGWEPIRVNPRVDPPSMKMDGAY
jgi:hypothetical protein